MSSGGIYNCAAADYSPETRKLLQVLMEESRLSIAQRQDFSSRMMAGAPLPQRARSADQHKKDINNIFELKRNFHFFKRNLQQIKDAGAYETDAYRPRNYSDRSIEKKELQEIMTYGKRVKTSSKQNHKVTSKIISKSSRIEELHREIEERMQFLEDMAALGQKAKYEKIIKQEIADKLREIDSTQKLSDFQFSSSN